MSVRNSLRTFKNLSPRLSVFRSSKHIYVQVIDDAAGKTLACASSMDKEIRGDLSRPHPLNRLLEGDVGSGKTVVAFLAAVAAAESGHQTALMAPTELLAEQHARTLRRLAAAAGEAAGLRMALLTSVLGAWE